MASSYRDVALVEDDIVVEDDAAVEDAVVDAVVVDAAVETTSMLSYSFISFAPGVSATYFSVPASLAKLPLSVVVSSSSSTVSSPAFVKSSSALRNASEIRSFHAASSSATSYDFFSSGFRMGGFPRSCRSVGGCSMSMLAMSSIMVSFSSMDSGLRISSLAMGGGLVHSLLFLLMLLLSLLSLLSLLLSPLSLSIIIISSSSSSSLSVEFLFITTFFFFLLTGHSFPPSSIPLSIILSAFSIMAVKLNKPNKDSAFGMDDTIDSLFGFVFIEGCGNVVVRRMTMGEVKAAVVASGL
mmetsp:Transcript_21953/g.41473  ORF Transcript_21953/g.41473 Transcript_21953/m.41473 type:complete len:297 (-) Transcript_21953:316-1206(-)